MKDETVVAENPKCQIKRRKSGVFGRKRRTRTVESDVGAQVQRGNM
ncbi:MAG: hypothetical protein JW818_18595 [Pirellulales bacterium]|nr:hypothetical protein [Pirellulales bacterium]